MQTFNLAYLKPRLKASHKGHFGHICIIGGHLGYSGAVRLAGEAALRAGAGAVSIATRPEHASTLNLSCPELMCHGIQQAKDLDKLLEKSTLIVIGPGLGTDAWSLDVLKKALQHQDKPTVLDADALNLIALHAIPMHRANCIFTPHPGEAARLLKTTTQHIQQDRTAAIKALCQTLGGTVILKGAGTLILSENQPITECPLGNPGMATAGMGDVLSGIIAGLAAQQIPLYPAAQLGVWIHARAGDLSAENHGERGMMASDLMPYIRQLVNGLDGF